MWNISSLPTYLLLPIGSLMKDPHLVIWLLLPDHRHPRRFPAVDPQTEHLLMSFNWKFLEPEGSPVAAGGISSELT